MVKWVKSFKESHWLLATGSQRRQKVAAFKTIKFSKEKLRTYFQLSGCQMPVTNCQPLFYTIKSY
jgi:hypothetical protein